MGNNSNRDVSFLKEHIVVSEKDLGEIADDLIYATSFSNAGLSGGVLENIEVRFKNGVKKN